MIEGWSEAADGEALVITFDGIDADRRDGAELAAFVRAVKAPSDDREDEQGIRTTSLFSSRRAMSPKELVQVLLFGVLGITTGWLAMSIGKATASLFGREISGVVQLVLMLLGFLAPLTLTAIGKWSTRRRDRAATREERFTLRFDRSGLTVSGGRVPRRVFALDTIDGFDGGARMGVLLRDGTRENLHCVLRSPGDHGSLAARVDGALRQLRASRADYRGGGRVRVAVSDSADTGEPSEDDDIGESSAARAARSPSK